MTLLQLLQDHGYETRVESEQVSGKKNARCWARLRAGGPWMSGSDALFAVYRLMRAQPQARVDDEL